MASYMSSTAGQFNGINAKTGEVLNKWTAGLGNMGDVKEQYYPSPTSAGKYLLVSSESTVLVLDPTNNYAEIARNTIPGKFRSCPIFVGESMYVRGLKAMYCIGK